MLGLIWNVMRTFLKFGDDDNKMSAQDSLKMWCQNQVGLRSLASWLSRVSFSF